MKLTVKELPEFTQRYLALDFTKSADETSIVVKHLDTNEIIAEIACEESTRNAVVQLVGSNRIVVLDDDGQEREVTVRKFDAPPSGTRNWAIVEVEEPTGETEEVEIANPAYQPSADGDDIEGVPQYITKTVPVMQGTGERVLQVWLGNGNKVELPIMPEPGPFTPLSTPENPIHEIVGQDHMLFTIALGIRLGKNTLMTGPTGIGKTSIYKWIAHVCNYNFIVQPISRGTQDMHLKGEYKPVGAGDFRWADGPTALAARLSQEWPTLLVIDEINRIGNVAEFATVYGLLDDQRRLELPEKRTEDGSIEVIQADRLYIGGTANPVDDDGGDYIGVKELDPAFSSRFPLQPRLGYPTKEIEAMALCDRVDTLDKDMALKMVGLARQVRESQEVRFPLSFRELEAWALLLPYFGYAESAEIAVVSKAAHVFRPDIRNLLQLQQAGS